MTINENSGRSHITDRIEGYVLGQLRQEESRVVTRHIAGCPECRRAVFRERQLAKMARETLAAVGLSTRERLTDLMPAVPAPRPVARSYFPWQKQLAAACIVLLVVLGSLGLQSWHRSTIWAVASPTAGSTVAIVTDTPTQIATLTMVGGLGAGAARPTVSADFLIVAPQPAITPVPVAPHPH